MNISNLIGFFKRKTLLEKGVDDGDIRDFLPEQCKCENYAYYMRLLHKACGQIMLKIHQQAEDEEVYVEKVLEAFEGEQNEGTDQDPEVINIEENTKEEEGSFQLFSHSNLIFFKSVL